MKMLSELFKNKEDKRKCIFCGNNGVTREHIYPKWSFDVFDFSDIEFQPMTHTTVLLMDERGNNVMQHTQRVGKDRNFSIKDFVVKAVCKTCNEGWMSVLEDEVKGIFTRLLQGATVLEGLSVEEASRLSLWCIIKTICVAKTLEFPMEMEQSVLNLIKDGFIPEGFVVETCMFPVPYINYKLTPIENFKARKISDEEMHLATDNSILCGFQLGCFAFRTSYLRTSVSVYRCQNMQPELLLYPYHGRLPWVKGEVHYDPKKLKAKDYMGLFASRLRLIDDINFRQGDLIYDEYLHL